MDFFGKEDLNQLLGNKGWPCVSMYLPTQRKGFGQENRIRYKHNLQEAERLLKELNHERGETGLAYPGALLEDDFFWQNQSNGLAVFFSKVLFRTYRLPLEFEELVVVADRFHLKPILPLLTNDTRFYILALSQNQVRFFQGSRLRIEEMNLESLPGSLSEALRFEEEEKQLQFHTGTPRARGDRAAMFHGQGVPADRDKDRILRYFRLIDAGIRDVLRNDTSLLMLAGVEFLFPIYREVNSYPYLMEQGIKGNPERIKAEDLHKRAWLMVEERLRENLDRVLGRYHDLMGTGKTSMEIEQIVQAASNGRIDSLIFVIGEQQWGTYNEESNEARPHREKEPGDQDLLDLAASLTILNGGSVYPVERNEIGADAPAMALFRY